MNTRENLLLIFVSLPSKSIRCHSHVRLSTCLHTLVCEDSSFLLQRRIVQQVELRCVYLVCVSVCVCVPLCACECGTSVVHCRPSSPSNTMMKKRNKKRYLSLLSFSAARMINFRNFFYFILQHKNIWILH